MPANGDGTGQVPPTSSPDSNGQVPPESHSQSSTSAASDNGATNSTTTSTANGGMTLEQALDALKKAREDAAKRRVDDKELADLRAYKQQQDDARLSETEKMQKQLAALQDQMAEKERMAQERVLRADIRSVARDLGLKPELAYRLLDYAAVTFDEDGDPTNVAELLAKAVEEFGLAPTAAAAASGTSSAQQPARTQQPSTPAAPAMGATNPSRGSQTIGANGRFTRGQVPSLSDPALWKRGGNN